MRHLSCISSIHLFSVVQWFFPVILACGIAFAPESPWWLVRKGRKEGALSVIKRLAAPDTDVQLSLDQIEETIALEARTVSHATYADCFKGVDRRRTVIAFMTFVLQQASGIIFCLGEWDTSLVPDLVIDVIFLGYSSYFFQVRSQSPIRIS